MTVRAPSYMNDHEERVQRELGTGLPSMSPERWEDLRRRIAEFASRRVQEANNHAQVVMLTMQLRHDAEMDILKGRG